MSVRDSVRRWVLGSVLATALVSPLAAETKKDYSFENLVDDVISEGYKKTMDFDGTPVTFYTAALSISLQKDGEGGQKPTFVQGTMMIGVTDVGSTAHSYRDLDGSDKIKFNFGLDRCGDCHFLLQDKLPFTKYGDNDDIGDTIPLGPKKHIDDKYDPATAQRLVDRVIDAALSARRNGAQFVK